MWLFVLEASLAPIIYQLNYILMLNQKKKINKNKTYMLGGYKSCGVWIKVCGVSTSLWIFDIYLTTTDKDWDPG